MGKSHISTYLPACSATTGGGKVVGQYIDSSFPSQKAELLLQPLNSGSNDKQLVATLLMLISLSHYKWGRRGYALARTPYLVYNLIQRTQYHSFPLSGQVAWEKVGDLFRLDHIPDHAACFKNWTKNASSTAGRLPSPVSQAWIAFLQEICWKCLIFSKTRTDKKEALSLFATLLEAAEGPVPAACDPWGGTLVSSRASVRKLSPPHGHRDQSSLLGLGTCWFSSSRIWQ